MKAIDWGTRRPPKYESAEELQDRISEYFASGIPERTVIVGNGKNKQAIQVPMPTIVGLTLFLGFADRSSFYDYEKKAEFSYTIKKARSFIELEYEEMLQSGGGSAAIFALKNFGWRDERQITMSEETDELNEILRDLGKGEDELEPPDDVQDNSAEATPDPTE